MLAFVFCVRYAIINTKRVNPMAGLFSRKGGEHMTNYEKIALAISVANLIVSMLQLLNN